jgi:uncharacterized protein
MLIHFRFAIFIILSIGLSNSNAGSYEDYFAAIEVDNDKAIGALFQRGFDPNTLAPNGDHGLVLAIRAKSLKVVDLLIQTPGTLVDVRTEKDETPLMLASLLGLTSVCEQLIARDADVNKPGWAPLHYAASGGHVAILRLLLDKYAYIDAASPNETTPLMMAAMYGNTQAVKVLLEAGADSTIKNSLGLTAIDFARRVDRLDSVELIAHHIRANRLKGTW